MASVVSSRDVCTSTNRSATTSCISGLTLPGDEYPESESEAELGFANMLQEDARAGCMLLGLSDREDLMELTEA
jgi:hypothetical protein